LQNVHFEIIYWQEVDIDSYTFKTCCIVGKALTAALRVWQFNLSSFKSVIDNISHPLLLDIRKALLDATAVCSEHEYRKSTLGFMEICCIKYRLYVCATFYSRILVWQWGFDKSLKISSFQGGEHSWHFMAYGTV
jgi:hypothetical protein